VSQPLDGRRILVTRAAHQAGKLSDGLRVLGAKPVEVPVLEILPPANSAPLDSALRQFATYDWLILTSANTVRSLVERIAALGVVAPSSPIQVAAIGSATAQAARDAGFRVTLTPESYVAESLVSALQNRIANKRVLLARAAVARDVIPDALRQAGAVVDVVDAYRNVVPEVAPQKLRQAVAQGLDGVTFTSSSSVIHLAEVASAAEVAFPLKNVPAISIGPITSETLREHNWSPAAEASQSDVHGLVEAVLRFFSK
jgi:uroporphyrinogen-III synthase